MQIATRTQGFDLANQPLFQHQLKAQGNTFVQYLTLRRGNRQLRDSIRQKPLVTARLLAQTVLAHGQPTQPVDLQGSHQTLRVIGMNARADCGSTLRNSSCSAA